MRIDTIFYLCRMMWRNRSKIIWKEITYLLSKVAIKSTSNFNLKGIFLFPFTENK